MDKQEFLERFEKVKVEEYPNDICSKPLVSVCVQTYNHVNYIEKCLDSILSQQTKFDFELLIGEDASSDGTREICLKYAEKYPQKIKLFLHHRENNIFLRNKPTGRFNLLYNLYTSRGKYIAICEGDDHWNDENKLSIQYDFLEKNESFAITGHDAFIFNSNEIISNSKLSARQKNDFNKAEIQNLTAFILTVSCFFRNRVQNIPDQILKVVNADTFLFSYLGNFGNYKYLPEIKPAGYRVHEEGAWSSLNKDLKTYESLTTWYWLSDYYKEINEIKVSDYLKLQMIELIIRNITETKFVYILRILKKLLKSYKKELSK